MMRIAHGALWLLAALVVGAPALAASTSSTTTTQSHAVVQPIHVAPLCLPAAGIGDVVAIPGIPNFQAQSIAEGTGASMMQLSVTQSRTSETRVAHGFITITKQIDAASPKLLDLLKHNTSIPTMTITMRKRGGELFEVWTLSNASVTSMNQPPRRGGSGSPLESVVFEYRAISVCSPAVK